MSDFSISLTVPVSTTINLGEEVLKKLTRKYLLHLLAKTAQVANFNADTDSFKIDLSGYLIYVEDFGHHRGGETQSRLHIATNEEKSLLNVINSL